jgi:hypothetical protein
MSKQSAGKTSQSPKSSFAARQNSAAMQRQHSFGPHLSVQREASGNGVQEHAPSLVREVVNSPGRPLDADTRSFMEPRLGRDLSRVRVHTDQKAAESAQAVSANAYTAGTHLAFAPGLYAPGTSSGRRLMAHELTHVAQQAEGPVAGTPIGRGVSVSHPNDSFERSASAGGSELLRSPQSPRFFRGVKPMGGPVSPRAISVQRDTPPDPNIARQTSAAETSATAGVASAAFGGVSALGALVSAFESIRSANFAERSAQAAEDPPVAEPTSGGVTSAHVELPEVKGIDPEHLSDYQDTTKVGEHVISSEGPSGGASTKTSKTSQLPKGKGSFTEEFKTKGATTSESSKLTETTAFKEAELPDQEKTFNVLRIREGEKKADGTNNEANFTMTLRYNTKDVRGGTTEDGQIDGYLGGTAQSNASVTFRASPGKHLDKGVASVRLLFGGTNVPPRKQIGLSTGFLGLGMGGAQNIKGYAVQRFSASARFSANGELVGGGPETLKASPGNSAKGKGTDDSPLVTVSLNAPATSGPAPKEVTGSTTPSATAGSPEAPKQ